MEERAFGRQVVFGEGCGVFARAMSWRSAGAFARGDSGIEFFRDPTASEVEWKFVRGETPGQSVDLDRSSAQLELWSSAPGLSEMQVQ